jgi:hypothetical protein
MRLNKLQTRTRIIFHDISIIFVKKTEHLWKFVVCKHSCIFINSSLLLSTHNTHIVFFCMVKQGNDDENVHSIATTTHNFFSIFSTSSITTTAISHETYTFLFCKICVFFHVIWYDNSKKNLKSLRENLWRFLNFQLNVKIIFYFDLYVPTTPYSIHKLKFNNSLIQPPHFWFRTFDACIDMSYYKWCVTWSEKATK